LLLACSGGVARADTLVMSVTHYGWTGAPMADGDYPYVGALACPYWMFAASAEVVMPDGEVYPCTDTGGGLDDVRGYPDLDFYGGFAQGEGRWGYTVTVEVVYP
jgi:hypothetical protein